MARKIAARSPRAIFDRPGTDPDRLTGELQSDQVQAFLLGAALTMAYATTMARWDHPAEGKLRLLTDLDRALEDARLLGMGEPEVQRVRQVAEAHQLSVVFLGAEVVAAAETIVNAMLRSR